MAPFDFFDRVYCINLDSRPDRWAASVAEFEKVGLTSRVERVSGVEHVVPNVGCSLAHIRLWKQILAQGYMRPLVLEDDVVFDDLTLPTLELGLAEITRQRIPWDRLFLGVQCVEPFHLVAPHVAAMNHSYGTHAMALARPYMERLLTYQAYLDDLLSPAACQARARECSSPRRAKRIAAGEVVPPHVGVDVWLGSIREPDAMHLCLAPPVAFQRDPAPSCRSYSLQQFAKYHPTAPLVPPVRLYRDAAFNASVTGISVTPVVRHAGMRPPGPMVTGLQALAATLPPDSDVVEVGSWSGESALIFLQAPTVRSLTMVDSYDPANADDLVAYEAQATGQPGTTMEEARALVEQDVLARYPNATLLHMTSVQAARHLAGRQFDLVYLDACHTEREVRQDILAWRRLVKPGGVLAGHDFSVRQHVGVTKAVRALLGRVQTFPDTSWAKRIGRASKAT